MSEFNPWSVPPTTLRDAPQPDETWSQCAECGLMVPPDEMDAEVGLCIGCVEEAALDEDVEWEQDKPDTKICPRCKQEMDVSAFIVGKYLKSYCRECDRDYRRERNKRKPREPRTPEEYQKAYDQHLRRTYGMTLAQYIWMFDSQGGVCALCGQPETSSTSKHGSGRRLAVDHDHETGLVRALLCSACNRGIGLLGHDIERLRAAIRYLQKYATTKR